MESLLVLLPLKDGQYLFLIKTLRSLTDQLGGTIPETGGFHGHESVDWFEIFDGVI